MITEIALQDPIQGGQIIWLIRDEKPNMRDLHAPPILCTGIKSQASDVVVEEPCDFSGGVEHTLWVVLRPQNQLLVENGTKYTMDCTHAYEAKTQIGLELLFSLSAVGFRDRNHCTDKFFIYNRIFIKQS